LTHDNDNEPALISVKDTEKEAMYCRTMLMNMAAEGEFPKPVKLGVKRVAFVRAEVRKWIDDRIAARAAA